MMGLMGFLLAKARILLKADSDNLSCHLIVLGGTLARQSSPAALLAPSLMFFPDPVGTLAILLLAWKMRKILFYRNRCQTKSFHLRKVNFLPKNPTRMVYQ
jgi:hypothetical protein